MEEDRFSEEIPSTESKKLSSIFKNKRKMWAFAASLMLVALGALIVLLVQNDKNQEWIVYSNEDFNFAFKHPTNWTIEESITKVNEHDKYRNLVLNIKNSNGDKILFSSDLNGSNARCKEYEHIDLGSEKIKYAGDDMKLYFAGDPDINDGEVHSLYLSNNSIPCYDNQSFFHEEIGLNAYGSERSGNEQLVIKLSDSIPVNELTESKKINDYRKFIESFVLITVPTPFISDINVNNVSGWKEYSNNSGFKFLYPNKGYIETITMGPAEDSGNVSYVYDDDKEFGVIIINTSQSNFDENKPDDLEQYVKSIMKQNIKSSKESASVEGFIGDLIVSSVSGIPSFEFENSDSLSYGSSGFRVSHRTNFIFLEHNNKWYLIYYPVDDELGKRILSTLEFFK